MAAKEGKSVWGWCLLAHWDGGGRREERRLKVVEVGVVGPMTTIPDIAKFLRGGENATHRRPGYR